MSKNPIPPFDDLDKVAGYLREQLGDKKEDEEKDKKYILLFAHNGIGKTRLSMEFKKQGGKGDQRDTLYFNAYTEDLFTWDNDLDNDKEYKLELNTQSKFFGGLEGFKMEDRIRPLLNRYTDFDFKIDKDKTGKWFVHFYRDKSDNIKVSRGEENIFIWCFFLAIVQLAIDNNIDTDKDNNKPPDRFKYIYIDDPVSSLDENNAIMVGSHLARLLKKEKHSLKTVISSHHTLFFNVIANAFGNADKYFLGKDTASNTYLLKDTSNTPFFHHVALLQELDKIAETDKLYTYHFNILRSILEKTAVFHGYTHFSACIEKGKDDADDMLDDKLYARIINILNHGNYSLFEPQEMLSENKDIFRRILKHLIKKYRFNPELFEESTKEKPK